jgi:hypothetical protein
MRLGAHRHVDWSSFKRLCKKWHNKVLMVSGSTEWFNCPKKPI